MSTVLIHDTNGVPVSIGTVVASPLPDGLTAVTLSPEDATKLLGGGWRWNPDTLAVDVAPPEPEVDPLDALAAQVAELQAALDALIGG
jgi:hypothetical protein